MNSRQRRKHRRVKERANSTIAILCQEVNDQAGEIRQLRVEHAQAIQELEEELSRSHAANCLLDQDNSIAMAKLLIKEKALIDAHACMMLIKASMPGSKYWSEYSQTIETIKAASGSLDHSSALAFLIGVG